MSCTEIVTFFRICCHVYKGFRHSQPCLQARVGTTCWNSLPPKIERYFVVKHCSDCLRLLHASMQAQQAADLLDSLENMHFHDLGEHPKRINPGYNSPQEAQFLAFLAQLEQMKYEGCTRTKAREKMEEEQKKCQFREREWTEAHQSFINQPGTIPGTCQSTHIVYNASASSRQNFPNDFLVEAYEPFEPFKDNTCSICLLDLEPEAEGCEAPQNLARSLPCGHAFHHPCIETWLISGNNPYCPHCKVEYNVMCNNGYEEPVYRRFPDEKKYLQVGGYIPFPKCGRGGMTMFKLDEEPDRWGNKLSP